MVHVCPWLTHVEHSLSIFSASSSHSITWQSRSVLATITAHTSQAVWITLTLVKAKVFLQEIVSLQYGSVNDRRSVSDCGGSFHVVILSGRSWCTRHMTTPFGATEFTDKVANFHPYCPVIPMKNGPSGVPECAGVLDACGNNTTSYFQLCTTSAVRDSLSDEAPTLGEIHGLTSVWKHV